MMNDEDQKKSQLDSYAEVQSWAVNEFRKAPTIGRTLCQYCVEVVKKLMEIAMSGPECWSPVLDKIDKSQLDSNVAENCLICTTGMETRWVDWEDDIEREFALIKPSKQELIGIQFKVSWQDGKKRRGWPPHLHERYTILNENG